MSWRSFMDRMDRNREAIKEAWRAMSWTERILSICLIVVGLVMLITGGRF